MNGVDVDFKTLGMPDIGATCLSDLKRSQRFTHRAVQLWVNPPRPPCTVASSRVLSSQWSWKRLFWTSLFSYDCLGAAAEAGNRLRDQWNLESQQHTEPHAKTDQTCVAWQTSKNAPRIPILMWPNQNRNKHPSINNLLCLLSVQIAA